MNNSSEERLKIAVFIDFDNIAIGVKQSLNRNFDVGTVLEAIKEKGQVISKIAYGDWKRAEDYSRAMTQHAVQMVQRNLTPGGDKNGADIALALDALEMAFTRDHINAFVIVGGDSDFIALVEKLKQYDKIVFVVGGRAFTSVILQKNCHEFISYENLVGMQPVSRRSIGKAPTTSSSALESALPLIRRALKILSDREVSPQLGLLKSTLLQLDSTFSERDYGVGSFRDFIQKLADARHVHLKQVDRSLLVELKETEEKTTKAVHEAPESAPEPAAETGVTEQPAAQSSEVSNVLEELLRNSKVKPHWPMYLRTFKQFLRSLQPPFDERPYGFSSTYELARQAQRDGLLRVERNRQGILRIYPGERFPRATHGQPIEEIVATAEPEVEVARGEQKTPENEPEPMMQLELPESLVQIQAEGTGSALESTQEQEPAPSDQTEQVEIVEQIAEESAPKPKAKRTRKKPAAAAKTAKAPRKTKSRAAV
jgi:uncharacterized LabA/DUF88 family protein